MQVKKISKAARKEFVKGMLKTNDAWALRALIVIYQHQTDDEQASGLTSHDNGVGFSGCDSEILSSFAVQYQNRRWLSPKQMAILFRKIHKYAGQIIANADVEKIDSMIRKSVA